MSILLHYIEISCYKKLSVRILILLLCVNLFPQQVYSKTDPEKSAVIYFEEKAYGIEEILSKYLQINSVSGSEMEAGVFLKKLCSENGLHITQMGEQNGNYNFTASVLPLDQNKPNIIFLNHLDVVPPGDISLWTHPPFSGKITDTEIWDQVIKLWDFWIRQKF